MNASGRCTISAIGQLLPASKIWQGAWATLRQSFTAWRARPDAEDRKPATRTGRGLRTPRLARGRVFRGRGHLRRQTPQQALRPRSPGKAVARRRRHGRCLVGRSPGPVADRPAGLPPRAPRKGRRSVSAPVGAGYFDAIGPGHVPDAGRLCRVQAVDDPGARQGRSEPRQRPMVSSLAGGGWKIATRAK
jgi:hypothetical protein